ncbi:MAG: Hsp70 family protein [SAR324 cluster bacterium]|nr:Hsp70 family protein [SAR324 cluster bacterium]
MIIGIDLGTTYSLASYVTDDGVKIIASADGKKSAVTRSIVCLAKGQIKVGEEAEKLRNEYPSLSIYSFKRFMGQEFDKLTINSAQFPYQIKRGLRNNILLGDDDKSASPEALSAYILKYLKDMAEVFLHKTIKKIVITVPAYFGDSQRQATKDAALIAMLEPVRIINEPTAAAIAYGLDQKKIGQVLVYDLGGGTFDVTVLKLKKKVFRVISTQGDNALGGDDFDQLLIDYVLDKSNIDKHKLTAKDKQLLKVSAEKTKLLLSTNAEADFEFTSEFSLGKKEPLSILKSEFDKLIAPIVTKTIDIITETLKSAKLTATDIDEAVLVGGSTRVPLVRKVLSDYFGKTPNSRIDPDKVVAYGAAIQGHMLAGKSYDYLLLDVVPLSLGIETIGGVFSKLILKNASLPSRVTENFSTSVDNQNSVDINIYQGEREFIKDCRLVGKFKLKGIPQMPAGLPRIEVEFLVDQNGILSVSAKELRSDVAANIELIPEHGLTRTEVTNMIEDSINFAFEDMASRSLIELTQKTKTMIVAVDRSMPKIRQILSASTAKDIKRQRDLLEGLLEFGKLQTLEAELEKLQDLTAEVADIIVSTDILEEMKKP